MQRTVALQPIAVHDLVNSASYAGTLDFAAQTPVYYTAASSTSGSSGPSSSTTADFVTNAPPVGSVIRRGEQVFSVNAQPTVLLYGTFPMYRSLESGVSDGRDVLQLKENLAAWVRAVGDGDERCVGW